MIEAQAEFVPPALRVDVALGTRSYPILIGQGLLGHVGDLLSQTLPGARFAIVADVAVEQYARALEGTLDARRLLLGKTCFIPSGESSKSFHELDRVCGGLLDLGLERRHAVIALGGGVAGDLAGFAAAILKRGVRVVQIPTTLLAQVDSSVGGKTGINAPHGKNLIGAFHQPSMVIADLDTLATLPRREFRSGYAEVVKYGVLGDADFFGWLEANGDRIFALETDALAHAVEKSCRMKAGIVARDEFETGDRALLNLGHTFGHAVEAWAGYSGDVLHGEAVALGMVLAASYSHWQGLCSEDVPERLKAHLRRVGFDTSFAALRDRTGRQPDDRTLLAFMEQDKKVRDGGMTLVLLKGMGAAFTSRNVARDSISAFLRDELAR